MKMKTIILLIVSTAFAGCLGNPGVEKKLQDSLYNESIMTAKINSGNILNMIDPKGQRQGKWEIFGRMQDDHAYNPEAKVEEGKYVDGQKEGEWMEYYPDGKLKNKGDYTNGKKSGRWTQYDENGKETGEAIYNR